MKLGNLLANYDVKPLSKFGGNRKNRTNSTSHSLRYPGGYRFVRPVTKGLINVIFAKKFDTLQTFAFQRNRNKMYMKLRSKIQSISANFPFLNQQYFMGPIEATALNVNTAECQDSTWLRGMSKTSHMQDRLRG